MHAFKGTISPLYRNFKRLPRNFISKLYPIETHYKLSLLKHWLIALCKHQLLLSNFVSNKCLAFQ